MITLRQLLNDVFSSYLKPEIQKSVMGTPLWNLCDSLVRLNADGEIHPFQSVHLLRLLPALEAQILVTINRLEKLSPEKFRKVHSKAAKDKLVSLESEFKKGFDKFEKEYQQKKEATLGLLASMTKPEFFHAYMSKPLPPVEKKKDEKDTEPTKETKADITPGTLQAKKEEILAVLDQLQQGHLNAAIKIENLDAGIERARDFVNQIFAVEPSSPENLLNFLETLKDCIIKADKIIKNEQNEKAAKKAKLTSDNTWSFNYFLGAVHTKQSEQENLLPVLLDMRKKLHQFLALSSKFQQDLKETGSTLAKADLTTTADISSALSLSNLPSTEILEKVQQTARASVVREVTSGLLADITNPDFFQTYMSKPIPFAVTKKEDKDQKRETKAITSESLQDKKLELLSALNQLSIAHSTATLQIEGLETNIERAKEFVNQIFATSPSSQEHFVSFLENLSNCIETVSKFIKNETPAAERDDLLPVLLETRETIQQATQIAIAKKEASAPKTAERPAESKTAEESDESFVSKMDLLRSLTFSLLSSHWQEVGEQLASSLQLSSKSELFQFLQTYLNSKPNEKQTNFESENLQLEDSCNSPFLADEVRKFYRRYHSLIPKDEVISLVVSDGKPAIRTRYPHTLHLLDLYFDHEFTPEHGDIRVSRIVKSILQNLLDINKEGAKLSNLSRSDKEGAEIRTDLMLSEHHATAGTPNVEQFVSDLLATLYSLYRRSRQTTKESKLDEKSSNTTGEASKIDQPALMAAIVEILKSQNGIHIVASQNTVDSTVQVFRRLCKNREY